MKLTNTQIYSYAQNIQHFNETNISLPIRINFYIQKNISNILDEAISIEKSRNFIIKKYGHEDPNNPETFIFDDDKVDIVQKELDDLGSIEQNIKIYKIKLSELVNANVDINTNNLQAIMFMIDDDLSDESKED